MIHRTVPIPPTQTSPPNFGEQDLIRRSASTMPPPARRLTEVAKLIDVSKCIGCKACQSACLEWNDLREEVGVNTGVYDNPHDLTPDSLTLMRFTEWENPETRQSRVADPQGRLHALRGSGLPQGLPGARRDRAVLERHRRLRPRELHRLRLLREGMPVQHPAHLQGRLTRPTSARSAPTASPSGRGRPAPRPARPRPSCSAPRRR